MALHDDAETQLRLFVQNGAGNGNGNDPNAQRLSTPLPRFQLFIVIFLQLAEPLTSQVIYPFVAQLIRDVGITGTRPRLGITSARCKPYSISPKPCPSFTGLVCLTGLAETP